MTTAVHFQNTTGESSIPVVVTRPDISKYPPKRPAVTAAALEIKEVEAAKLATHRHLARLAVADAVEADPVKAKEAAYHALAMRLQRETATRPFSEGEWDAILREKTLKEICALLRDSSPQTEQLRICHPFAGLLTQADRLRISRQAYGA